MLKFGGEVVDSIPHHPEKIQLEISIIIGDMIFQKNEINKELLVYTKTVTSNSFKKGQTRNPQNGTSSKNSLPSIIVNGATLTSKSLS